VRSHLITTYGGYFDYINRHFHCRVPEKASSDIPMVWVEACAPRAGFVHPRDGLILWTHSVTVASTKLESVWLGHEDAMSWEGVNRFVGNEIEQNIEISLIESRKNLVSWDKESGIWCLRINDINRGMHRGQHGFLESTIDHWSDKCLDHVWSISWPVGWHT
jgi:hypothetical protein